MFDMHLVLSLGTRDAHIVRIAVIADSAPATQHCNLDDVVQELPLQPRKPSHLRTSLALSSLAGVLVKASCSQVISNTTLRSSPFQFPPAYQELDSKTLGRCRTGLGPNEVDIKDLSSLPNASEKDAATPAIQKYAEPPKKQVSQG